MINFGKMAVIALATVSLIGESFAQGNTNHHNTKPKPAVHKTVTHTVVRRTVSHHPTVKHHTSKRRRSHRHSHFKRTHSLIKTRPNGVHAPHAKPAPKSHSHSH